LKNNSLSLTYIMSKTKMQVIIRIGDLPIFLFLLVLINQSNAFSIRNSSGRPQSSRKHRVNNKSAQTKRKGYSLRRSNGVRKNRKRPARWETEGDALFFVSKSDEVIDVQGDTPSQMLQNLIALQKSSEQTSINKVLTKAQKGEEQEETLDQKKLPPNLSWGPLSTGPILSPKLQTLYESPTPIQIECFRPITNKKNVVIAAATGSGKTLAYILPLLCRVPRKSFGAILIVTPSTELALQIQSVVDDFWAPASDEQDSSSVYVIRPDDSTEQDDIQSIIIEMMIEKRSTPILAGTAGSISSWLGSCIRTGHGREVLKNLETVVLDEADRLLQTETLARIEHDKKKGVTSQGQNNKRRLQKQSETINLLELIKSQGVPFYAGSKKQVQLICASATVGRTLRRQVMELTDATSVDMGSVLVCADERVGKDAERRKKSLLPESIQHTFVVQEDTDMANGSDIVKLVWGVMKQLPPGPSLIFPGKTGVQETTDTLVSDCGLEVVKTLRENVLETSNILEKDSDFEDWKYAPVFVIGEKFGRGLDISNVRYVFLAGGPPNSPAAYAHLAGRTGRGGRPGKAITFVRNMKDAKRIVTIGHKLGLAFSPLLEDATSSDAAEDGECVGSVSNDESIFTEEELANLTVPVLKEILKERGQKVAGRKIELVQRLLETQ
jgi:superfamily II DNA/RNA helicase